MTDRMSARVAQLQAAMEAAPVILEECKCLRTEVRTRFIRGGSQQCIRQCLDCGQPVGNPVKAVDNCTFFDDDLKEAWIKRRADERAAARAAEGRDWWALYQAYIISPEWAALRRRVLYRDGGLCQGCLIDPATEVHHLSYRNFGNEFAFDLISLCKPCHDRIHGDDKANEAGQNV